jgi:hypothetical protein
MGVPCVTPAGVPGSSSSFPTASAVGYVVSSLRDSDYAPLGRTSFRTLGWFMPIAWVRLDSQLHPTF